MNATPSPLAPTVHTHEVPVGFSLYWVRTWPEASGYAYEVVSSVWHESFRGLVAGSRQDALAKAREVLRAYDARASREAQS